jgi:hypothetical protein
MPVKLADVIARAKATEPELDDGRILRLVSNLIAACGLEVADNGEVFNPAEGSYRQPIRAASWSAPGDNSRQATRFRRRR